MCVDLAKYAFINIKESVLDSVDHNLQLFLARGLIIPNKQRAKIEVLKTHYRVIKIVLKALKTLLCRNNILNFDPL